MKSFREEAGIQNLLTELGNSYNNLAMLSHQTAV